MRGWGDPSPPDTICNEVDHFAYFFSEFTLNFICVHVSCDQIDLKISTQHVRIIYACMGPDFRFLDPLLGSYVTSSVRQSVTKVLILPVISFLRFFASSYSLMSLKK